MSQHRISMLALRNGDPGSRRLSEARDPPAAGFAHSADWAAWCAAPGAWSGSCTASQALGPQGRAMLLDRHRGQKRVADRHPLARDRRDVVAMARIRTSPVSP